MEEIIKNLSKWAEGKGGYPTQIQIHPTNYCNLKCFFCPTRALLDKNEVSREKELTTEKWLNIIEEANELGVKEWHICGGGEPMFFSDDAIAIMNKIKEYEKYGEMITNGTLFNENIIKGLVEIGWDKIFFSLDAPDAEIQDWLRGVECFDKIVENIKLFVYWKKKLKVEKPVLCFHVVVCNKNYRKILGMIKLAKKLDMQEVSINALNIWKKEIERLKLNKKQENELRENLKKIISLTEKYNIPTNFRDFINFDLVEKANVMDEAQIEAIREDKNKFSSIPCYYPWYNISIFADGNVLPCFILKDKGENVKKKSLKEIWFGNYFEEIRKMFLKNRLKKDCSKCNPWNLPKMEEIREKLRKSQ